MIEYLDNDLSRMSSSADAYLSENSSIFKSVQGILPAFGGAITNGVAGESSYSVIAKSGASVTNHRAVISMHEVLGHGLAIIRGFSEGENQVQALRVENLVRRMIGLPLFDGFSHPYPEGANLIVLPRIK